jgi:hypothetical protein
MIMSRRAPSVETLLADLAAHIEWPEPVPGPDLAPRLASPGPITPRRRWIPATAVVVALITLLLVLSPRAREAVADLLGVAGIEIELQPELEVPIGSDLALGRAVSLEDGIESVDFPARVPTRLPEPDGVYVSEGRLDMVWEGQALLPAAGDTGVGVLYSQFASETGGDRFVKGVGPGSDVVPVEVGASTGFWIEGAPHIIFYEDGSGQRVEESVRLAGNVLMWETDGVTHRLETAVGLDEALRIAESVRASR